MHTLSLNQFRDHINTHIDQVIDSHNPIKVTLDCSKAFVILGADDWEREQETLYVLQNKSLMAQIRDSLASHNRRK
ncbi:type II toxin-antitoxin system Phd/YefM family antitoxin [Rheinheimera sp. 1928-s]|uniref:type II toxin-antitoxin system Phd/YefM family antitoxin n=1 Tax=Rheinheimera sp. 1928-s TaxID=3033803 RepID=UPI0026265C0B|nr:type II toxin-antitoxin system Phd/YefM family antitoxin [Rheinheimera sp. 1928-s]MDF3123827.1 type II toxin-antitoxin system Phd/YefM family antitoxin [Rheinheimera sp. 1928-s]